MLKFKLIYVLLIILSIYSCNNRKPITLYYPNGNKKVSFYLKNNKTDSIMMYYYSNGNLRKKGNYIDGKKEGWFKVYDSINKDKIIEKGYYVDDKLYTFFEYDDNKKCDSFYIKPYIPIKEDTLYLTNDDSIPVLFFKDDRSINIDNFIVEVFVIVDNKEEIVFLEIHPFKNKSYINFNNKWYVKDLKYKLYVQIIDTTNSKKPYGCNCIKYGQTSKYVFIK